MKKVILVLPFLLSACLSTGHIVQQEQLNAIERGVTTEEQLVAELGKPAMRFVRADGSKKLTYSSTLTSVEPDSFIPILGAFTGGAETTVQSLDVSIDPRGIVTDWNNTETTSYIDLEAGRLTLDR